MKNTAKHIFALLLSVLFIWNGLGANYVVFNCLGCQSEKVEEQSHGCCDKTCCSAHSHFSGSGISHCEENSLYSPNHFLKNLNSNHAHNDGNCVYIVEHKIDIQNNSSEISVPSIKLFDSDLFLPFICLKNESKSDFYTSFVPIRHSTNTVLSTLCVFLI